MLALFGSLKALLKRQSTNIDNFACKLHYRVTVMILLVFTIMVSAGQFYGDPIKCMSEGGMATDMIEAYCWIHSTYSVPSAWNQPIGTHVPYPGITNGKAKNQRELVYHTYYLWVPLILFAMSITFYIPRYMWKNREAGIINSLVSGLQSVIITDDQRQNGINVVTKYFKMNLHNNNGLFVAYIACEFLNLANVILQMHFVNRFLNGAFTSYGWNVLMHNEWTPEVDDDPMVRVFPTMTKCKFYFGGPGGDNNEKDVLCLLPINILNQKIFIFLWAWFYFLLIITIFSLIFRAITFTSLTRRCLIQSRCYPEYREEVGSVVNKLSIADWFLLDLISRNMSRNYFNDFIMNYRKSDKDCAPNYVTTQA